MTIGNIEGGIYNSKIAGRDIVENIFQIINQTIPRPLLIVIGVAIAVMVVLGVVNLPPFQKKLFPTPTPTVTPLPFAPAGKDETLILVVTFHHTQGVVDTDAHNEIRRAIQKATTELHIPNFRVEVTPTSLTTDARNEAKVLGNRYNASIIIWGSDTGVRITVNYLNLKEPNFKAADVEINETERNQLATPDAYAHFITNDLPGQLTFLSLFSVGQSYYSQGKYQDAIKVIKKALEEREENPLEGIAEAYFLLGWLYQRPAINDLEQIITNYTQVIELDPENALAYNNRGVAYSKLGDPVRSIEDYTQAITLNPNFAVVYNNLGVAYRINNEYDQAIANYSRAIELKPNNTLTYYNRGTTYYAEGDYDQAIQDFNKAIQLDPNNAQVYISRGFVYYDKGEYDQAIADYTKVIQVLATNDTMLHTALLNRGNVYMKQGKYNQATADFNSVINLSEDSGLRRQAAIGLDKLKIATTGTAAAIVAGPSGTATAKAVFEKTATAALNRTATVEALRAMKLVRPLTPGVSIGCESCDTSSTLGYFVIDPAGQLYILSAGGLIRSEIEAVVTQPSWLDGGQIPQDIVGHISRLNYRPNVSVLATDITVLIGLEPDIEIDPIIPNIGPVQGVRQPEIGMVVRKLGHMTGVTTGEVMALNQEIDVFVDSDIVMKRDTAELFISDLKIPDWPLREGVHVIGAVLALLEFENDDIGALVVDNEGYAIGILIGGSADGEAVLAPIQQVLTRFRMDLYQSN